jgi:hypothetical protein
VVGKFKDECQGVPMTEFVGLKAKMYSYSLAAGKGDCKAKGIAKSVVERDLTHEMYVKCAKGEIMRKVTIHSLMSKNHQMFKTESQKQSLDCFNSKRWLCPDKNRTLPFGHWKARTS